MASPGADELRRALREQAGLDIVTLRPASGGESGTAFWATDRTGSVTVVKVLPEARRDVTDRLRALSAVVARLRDRGYPAARILAVGQVPGLAFWVQERLPGTVLDPGAGPAAVAGLLPELIRLNDAQEGLGTGPGGWPRLLLRTLRSGGDGYCVHATLEARADTREILRAVHRIGDRCGGAVPAARDFVHYDFTAANLLTDGTGITGVIDVSPPVLAGDRAFDLATMVFYCYDHDDVRTRLHARLRELASPPTIRVYLAHMVLRQVDWSLRFHPAAAATRRHLRLARLVMADIGR
jgi:Phosphotransferase enzyme family